jgi:hypothetical protein
LAYSDEQGRLTFALGVRGEIGPKRLIVGAQPGVNTVKKTPLFMCIAAFFACSALAAPKKSETQLVCKDGTSITVEQTRGACSGHGGIDKAASKDQHASTRTLGAGADKVWVNESTKVYHCRGDVYYGKTKKGEYMSEREAKGNGFRPDHGKACGS